MYKCYQILGRGKRIEGSRGQRSARGRQRIEIKGWSIIIFNF
jgi:hypothetical protein